MKKLILIITLCGMMTALAGCGTEQIVVPENKDRNENVIYVSPADTTSSTEPAANENAAA